DPCCCQAQLDQGGTVQPQAAASAPKVGNAEETTGGRREVGLQAIQLHQVLREDPAATGKLRIAIPPPDHGKPGSEGKKAAVGSSDFRFRQQWRTQYAKPMGRLGLRLAQGLFLDPADVAIAQILHPSVALLPIEDQQRFPEEKLAVVGAIGAWAAFQVDAAKSDRSRRSLDEALGIDLAAQALIREVGSEGMKTRIQLHKGDASLRFRLLPGLAGPFAFPARAGRRPSCASPVAHRR